MRCAIVMMCILKRLYVIGGCMAAWTHKKMLLEYYKKNTDISIDLVIMCDKEIYKAYKGLLKLYFDKVKKIKLRNYNFDITKHSDTWKSKYSDWIGMSVNKWQCMKYTDYDKVLFLDIDILPITYDFYNLFKIKTPAFNLINIQNKEKWNEIEKECQDGMITRYNFPSYNEMISTMKWSANGGLVLLKPSKKKYKKYFNFIDNEIKNNMKSSLSSGPDETTLLYFFSKKFYRICSDNNVPPWDIPNPTHYIKKAKSINYLGKIKPWAKPLFYMWEEEMIWKDIYNIMEHNNQLDKLYKMILEEGMINCNKNKKVLCKNNMYLLERTANPKSFEQISNIENKVIRKKGYGIIDIKDLKNIIAP